jgi:hypothetical protein
MHGVQDYPIPDSSSFAQPSSAIRTMYFRGNQTPDYTIKQNGEESAQSIRIRTLFYVFHSAGNPVNIIASFATQC